MFEDAHCQRFDYLSIYYFEEPIGKGRCKVLHQIMQQIQVNTKSRIVGSHITQHAIVLNNDMHEQRHQMSGKLGDREGIKFKAKV